MNFNRASLEEICSHFETCVDGQGMRDRWTKSRMCIIIDEESLQTLKGETVEEAEAKLGNNSPLRYVKVLEAFPIVDEYDTFPGWMKCWTHVLWDLWANMQDGYEMRMQFEFIGEDDEGVYMG